MRWISCQDSSAAPGAPEEVRSWFEESPEWLEVRAAQAFPVFVNMDPHVGERDVLALAGELAADLVILDDQAARRRVAEIGQVFTGLVGILDRAAKRQLMDLKQAVRRYATAQSSESVASECSSVPQCCLERECQTLRNWARFRTNLAYKRG